MSSDSLLLTGGMLIDGSGAPRRAGDVLIAGDRIAAVGRFDPPSDARTIDCKGLAVAPGFIDAHSHSDLQVLQSRTEKTAQGVTTEVVGNCGFSAYPAAGDRKPLHDFANGIFCGDESWGWPDAKAYLDESRRSAKFTNVVSLVGHGTLRIAFAGNKLGPLSCRELDAMEQSLSDSLVDGAAGFSTGLMYAPGASAPDDELFRLCRVVARHSKVYATHIRDYGFHLEEAIDEQLSLARRTGCRLHISHMQTVGHMNWARQQQIIEKLEAAKRDGVDVAFDCYPYVAGSTVLTQLLPQSSLAGGIPGLMSRLQDSQERSRIGKETAAAMPHRWKDIVISAVASSANKHLVGKSIEEIAHERSREPVDTILDLIVEEQGAVNMITFNQSEENLRQTLTHPLSVVISDGFYVHGRPHPRLYGTFPCLLGTMARDRKWMSLEDAVHRITAKPAERFHIRERGELRAGYYADAVVFDPDRVGSPATYEDPERAPEGIRYVLRNGEIIWPA